MLTVYLLIISVILLSFANGANDVSKGIATLVGSGVTSYKKAIVWGTVWTIAGGIAASVFALELVKTFSSSGIVKASSAVDGDFMIAVSLGAFGWVLLTARAGFPVSTTHSIAGAICGAGIAAVGIDGILWSFLGKKIFLPLLLSPLVALGISWIVSPLINGLSKRFKRYCLCLEVKDTVTFSRNINESGGQIAAASQVSPYPETSLMAADKETCESSLGESSLRFEFLDIGHWLSSGAASFARGMNDGPKIAALGLAAGALGTGLTVTTAFFIVAAAMGAGSIIAGLKVTETLSEKITPMTHEEGFSANLTTSLLVTFASRLGFPVSTTHVSSGAIIGIGIMHGKKTVKWNTLLEIILAWIITLPVAALLAFFAFRALH